MKLLVATATVAAALLAAAPASADTLLQPAPNGTSLAAGGGYLAWLAPTAGGQGQLTVRAPGAAAPVTPPLPPLPRLTRLEIGSGSMDDEGDRPTYLTYPRDGRVRALDLATLRETTVGTLRGVRAVGVDSGRFVAANGRGVWAFSTTARPRRLSRTQADIVAVRQSRVAYTDSRDGRVLVQRHSGRGSAIEYDLPGVADLDMSRYRLFAMRLTAGPTMLSRSDRFNRSGRLVAKPKLEEVRARPDIIRIALEGDRLRLFQTSEGVFRFGAETSPFPNG